MPLQSLTRGLLLAGVVALVPFPVHAQDAARADGEGAAARHVRHVQERLDLSASQAAVLEEAMAQQAPGARWAAAAALVPTLTPDQRARLTAPPERPARAPASSSRAARPGDAGAPERDPQARRRGGAHPDHEAGGAERGDGVRPGQAADFAAVKAARDAALGLRPDQAAALDRLEAAHRQARTEGRTRGARPARRPTGPPRAEGPLPDAVAEILDPEQEAVWLLYHALAPRRPGGHGGPDLGVR